MSETLPLLVTAPPRSGTLSVARALAAMGLDIGHESTGRDGSVSCFLGFPSADAGRRDLGTHVAGGLECFEFRHVARILRHPLASIASLAALRTPGLWRFVERELSPVDSALSNASLIAETHWPERAARTWLAWEASIVATWGPFEGVHPYRDRAEIRLEELPGSLDPVGVWTGRDLPRKRFHEHRSQHRTLTWETLRDEIPEDVFGSVRAWASMEGYT